MRLFKYKELFRVTIRHDYYQSGYSPDFVFGPSGECRAQLKRHSLKFKLLPHGFAVFGDVVEDGGAEKLARKFTGDTKFTFSMKLANPFFVNFTDVPVRTEPRRIYYFNNLDEHAAGGERYLADKAEIPKPEDNRARIGLHSKTYQCACAGAGEEKTGTVTVVDDNVSYTQTVKNDNGVFRFQFDLARFNPGRCVFAADAETERFYASQEMAGRSVFGIVEIFVKDTVPGGYRFVDHHGVVTTREYVIPFTNRRTVWRYLVHDKMTNRLSEPQITMAGAAFKRETTPASQYPQDYTLHSFVSVEEGAPDAEKTLPIQEKPVLNITLSGEVNGGRRDIVQHLPMPDIRLIKPDSADPEKIYSDILLYV